MPPKPVPGAPVGTTFLTSVVVVTPVGPVDPVGPVVPVVPVGPVVPVVPVGPVVPVVPEVPVTPASVVEVVVVVLLHSGTWIRLLSRVTAPVRASARPSRDALVVSDIDACAITVRYQFRPTDWPAAGTCLDVRRIDRRCIKADAHLAGRRIRISQLAGFHHIRRGAVFFIPCCKHVHVPLALIDIRPRASERDGIK